MVDWDKKTYYYNKHPENKDSILLKVYIKDEDRLVIMDLEEYVKGAAAAEIPLNFHEEAVGRLQLHYVLLRLRGYGSGRV